MDSQTANSAEYSSLELAQMFIRANEELAADNKKAARPLLEAILKSGNHVQRDIAKDLLIKLDGGIKPVDLLTTMTPAQAALAAAQTVGIDQAAYSQSQQRQGFVIGNLRLMIDYADGRELTDLPHLHHLPSAPNFVLGYTNLHGVVIPVFDLMKFFALSAPVAKPRLLVLATAADTIGVVVDGLPVRLRFDESDILDNNLAPPKLRPVVAAGVRIEEELWFDLDVEALFNALEHAIE